MLPRCASSSDTVREIKYQILQFTIHDMVLGGQEISFPKARKLATMARRKLVAGLNPADGFWMSDVKTVREIKYQILQFTIHDMVLGGQEISFPKARKLATMARRKLVAGLNPADGSWMSDVKLKT